MPALYLVRHCQATGGAPDAPLTQLGFDQASELAAHLKDAGIRRIVSSPYLRAVQTVEPLARSLGLAIQHDARLAERSAGWDPARHAEFVERSFLDFDYAPYQSESSRLAQKRAAEALQEMIADDVLPTVAVGHGQLFSLLLHYLDQRDPFRTWLDLTNPDVFSVTASSVGYRIERVWI
jgi:2,3-bisphosphoglycerate-dependent phosphoglycerate mutase